MPPRLRDGPLAPERRGGAARSRVAAQERRPLTRARPVRGSRRALPADPGASRSTCSPPLPRNRRTAVDPRNGESLFTTAETAHLLLGTEAVEEVVRHLLPGRGDTSCKYRGSRRNRSRSASVTGTWLSRSNPGVPCGRSPQLSRQPPGPGRGTFSGIQLFQHGYEEVHLPPDVHALERQERVPRRQRMRARESRRPPSGSGGPRPPFDPPGPDRRAGR